MFLIEEAAVKLSVNMTEQFESVDSIKINAFNIASKSQGKAVERSSQMTSDDVVI